MPKPFLSPKSDLVFKLIFGTPGNMDILAGFLQSVLDIPIGEYGRLEPRDPALKPDSIRGKEVILDIKAVTAYGIIINVEIQLNPHPFMWERFQYYLDRLFVEQISRGGEYGSLKKVVGVLITDYILLTGIPEYHNQRRQLSPRHGSIGTDLKEMHILELPKLPRDPDGSELWKWLKFIRSQEEEDFALIAQMGSKFRRAVEVLRAISENEETRALNEAREKARMDEDARMLGAREEGKADGIEKGRIYGFEDGKREGRIEMVRNALRMGMSPEAIVTLTGLPEETIRSLIGD